MNLQYGGRPVSWFGVGSLPDVGAGIAALQAAAAQYRSPRITNPGKAVADLQVAGNAAVSTVGPAIDALSGGNPDVMKLTQLVWRQNARLADVASSGATGSDVDTVKGIVNQMIDSYQEAAKLAASLAPRRAMSGPAPAPRLGGSLLPAAPPPSPDAPPGGVLDWLAANQTAVLIVSSAVVVVGGVALAAASRSRATA